MSLQKDYGVTIGYIVKDKDDQIVLVDKHGIALPKSIIKKLHQPNVTQAEYLKAARAAING